MFTGRFESELACLLGGLNQSLHVYWRFESELACLLGGLNQSLAGMFTGRFESEPADLACLLGGLNQSWHVLLGGLNLHQLPFLFKSCALSTV